MPEVVQAGVFLFVGDTEEVDKNPMLLTLLEGSGDIIFMASPLAGLGLEYEHGDVAASDFLVDDFLVVLSKIAYVEIVALDKTDHDVVVAE